ncbi:MULTISPECIES: hypothetical protein [Pseudomonas]|uniref:Uncharacterized protein n=1 Tax=Pseudomonas frederiksbergensis TaxID=104087 RepID=A0A2S8HFT7_9PSED|nr:MULTISPECIES: hypothetical protein [Pseudomonas]PQP01384.1 hypothetical protein C5612_21080 [Pseudomonas frederiksbergensis]WLG49784.1 hypothetical protein PSH64_24150 [Pseudomonas sp. FP1742]
MTKFKKRITNPMTIIAIFATLSETSAAVSLPFLDNKERELYIWFLISFPFYLLFLFFATLNFNYRSLYAPSDFEKGKHFIKAMDNADHSGNSTSREPPENPAQHHVHLPAPLKDLHIIDARWINKRLAFSTLMESIQHPPDNPAQVIVFLTCADSEILLKENALKHRKQIKKRNSATFCISYNLSSQGVTIMG